MPKLRAIPEMQSIDWHDYSVFGLKLRSAIELPELPGSDGSVAPDVIVSIGQVQANGLPAGIHRQGDTIILIVESVGRFLITGGREILIDADALVPPKNVRLYLLGSAFGILLHQRGMLPLHANAIDIGGKAYAFMGESGAGKSTLAAWFHDQGHRVLADDVCVVSFDPDDGRAIVYPGLSRLRLWQDALEESGRDAGQYERSYEHDTPDKFDVPVSADGRNSRIELGGIYLLERSDCVSIRALDGVAGAEAIWANTYRGNMVAMLRSEKAHMGKALDLLNKVPMFVLARPLDHGLKSEVGQMILDHVHSNPATPEESVA